MIQNRVVLGQKLNHTATLMNKHLDRLLSVGLLEHKNLAEGCKFVIANR